MQLERKYRVRHGRLPLAAFIAHPQMRVTVDEGKIEELAENILLHGLIHPICVASTAEGYMVISGHRRLRACRLLEERGYRVGELAVIIFEHITPVEMALLQASENIHEEVPPDEAARFYEATWRMLKVCDPAFTLADFSRAVGRSEQTIRNALRFVLLPDSIQKFVTEGFLSYGSAVYLARLQTFLAEEELRQWAIRIIVSRKKVSDVKAQVETYLADLRSGQLSLLDIFHESAREELEKQSRRILIDRATTQAFWESVRYLERLLFLFKENKLTPGDSPWLRRNPRRAFRKLIAFHRRTLDHMRGVLSSQEVQDAEDILRECERFSSQFEEQCSG